VTCHNTQRFNSRAHAGRDDELINKGYIVTAFQFTRPRGARRSTMTRTAGRFTFQFTRPRGARQFIQVQGDKRPSFNSRAHAGRDNKFFPIAFFGNVSIHAPTRGATLLAVARGMGLRVSIHAPTRGATKIWTISRPARPGFNSRAHAGRDFFAPVFFASYKSFNSRAHAGRDAAIASTSS